MYDLVVVGAGPQALTLCTYLLAGRTGPPPRIAVCDPAGWLGAWHERFAALAIGHLRSPAVHHRTRTRMRCSTGPGSGGGRPSWPAS